MKHWKPHHVGRASVEAFERIREAVIGYARSGCMEPREIEGVEVRVVRHDAERHFVIAGEELPAGVPVTTVVRAIVSAASHNGAAPLA